MIKKPCPGCGKELPKFVKDKVAFGLYRKNYTVCNLDCIDKVLSRFDLSKSEETPVASQQS